jgi:murein DD-endopeptidase MepM/ murein hydrolase activator NlpD
MKQYKESKKLYLYSRSVIFTVLFIISSILYTEWQIVYGQTGTDIKSKIDEKSQEIDKIEKEIASYQKQIDELNNQAQSLSSTIKSLELTQKKLSSDIKLTENKIINKNNEIKGLSKDIGEHALDIEYNKKIIATSFALLRENGDYSIVENILGSASVSEAIKSTYTMQSLQTELFENIDSITTNKNKLEKSKTSAEKAKAELEKLKKQLSSQNTLVQNTKAEQDKLLKDTQRSESTYQVMLNEKLALKEAFETELEALESQITTSVNQNILPSPGSGVLLWPLSNIYITQQFGNTAFANANARIYNGKGHTGIDLRASIGTPVYASQSGTVIGIANTDIVKRCYSYGKWVMVRHENGLSTLYAHLSLWNVSMGQKVNIGDLIGYSGNTGYSTGPHLHFGVYASDAVQIKKLTAGESKNCAGATIPVAPFSAYLNPITYLKK